MKEKPDPLRKANLSNQIGQFGQLNIQQVGSVFCSILLTCHFTDSIIAHSLHAWCHVRPPPLYRAKCRVGSIRQLFVKSASTVVSSLPKPPVRFDSFTCEMAPAIHVRRNLFTGFSTTISPTTTSLRESPLLSITNYFHKVSSFTAFSRSNFFPASYSRRSHYR